LKRKKKRQAEREGGIHENVEKKLEDRAHCTGLRKGSEYDLSGLAEEIGGERKGGDVTRRDAGRRGLECCRECFTGQGEGELRYPEKTGISVVNDERQLNGVRVETNGGDRKRWS